MSSNTSKNKNANLWQRIGYHFISCANICSIHGFCHIVRKNVSFYERLLWFFLVTSATAWCIELALQAWDHYQTRPTVISLERDHWKWNTTFPAATLCLHGIDNNKAEELMAELGISPEDDEFKKFLAALVTTDFKAYKDFDKYINLSLYQNVTSYLKWAIRTSQTLDFPVDISPSVGESKKFNIIVTEMGICFAYNSRIAIYNTPDYWVKSTSEPVDVNDTIIMINPTIRTPAVFIRNMKTGYKIFFHGPNEIPEMSTKRLYTPPDTIANFELALGTVWTPSEVKNLAISQRQCRMLDEPESKHAPIYTYNLCKSECRRNLCLKLCNCTPFFYKRLGKEPICNPSGMRCLYEHETSIIDLRDKAGQSVCSCIQNCNVDSVTITKYEAIEWFLGTNLQWKVTEYPIIRYKRSLIYSRTNLLVQIGAVFGLFLGCSVLSLLELVYFFTLRFYWGVIKGRTI